MASQAILVVVHKRRVNEDFGQIIACEIVFNRSQIGSLTPLGQMFDVCNGIECCDTVLTMKLGAIQLRFPLVLQVTVGHVGDPRKVKIPCVGGGQGLF